MNRCIVNAIDFSVSFISIEPFHFNYRTHNNNRKKRQRFIITIVHSLHCKRLKLNLFDDAIHGQQKTFALWQMQRTK